MVKRGIDGPIRKKFFFMGRFILNWAQRWPFAKTNRKTPFLSGKGESDLPIRKKLIFGSNHMNFGTRVVYCIDQQKALCTPGSWPGTYVSGKS